MSIKNNIKTSDIENLGAELFGRINFGKNSNYFVNSDSVFGKHDNFLGHFLHGLKLNLMNLININQKRRKDLFHLMLLVPKINRHLKVN